MERLIKQEIINLLKKTINYPIYVLDSQNKKRKISNVSVHNGSISIVIDGYKAFLVYYSYIFQYNLYKELKNNINNKIWTD